MYEYKNFKAQILTDKGQRLLISVYDTVSRFLNTSGAVSLGAILANTPEECDSWLKIACIDRLIEIGKIRELTPPGVHGQDRVFVRD